MSKSALTRCAPKSTRVVSSLVAVTGLAAVALGGTAYAWESQADTVRGYASVADSDVDHSSLADTQSTIRTTMPPVADYLDGEAAPLVTELLDIAEAAPTRSVADYENGTTIPPMLDDDFIGMGIDDRCREESSSVWLPWLGDDMDRACDQAEAESRPFATQIVWRTAASWFSRNCDVLQRYSDDWPEQELAVQVETTATRAQSDPFDIVVSQRSAEIDNASARARAIVEELSAEVKTLATKDACLEARPGLSWEWQYRDDYGPLGRPGSDFDGLDDQGRLDPDDIPAYLAGAAPVAPPVPMTPED